MTGRKSVLGSGQRRRERRSCRGRLVSAGVVGAAAGILLLTGPGQPALAGSRETVPSRPLVVTDGASSIKVTAAVDVAAREDSPHPPTLLFNGSVSSIRIGESRSRVIQDWGKGKRNGGLYIWETPKAVCCSYRYAVRGGYLQLGFYKGHVVFIATNSQYFKTTEGVGVGYKIHGKRVTLDGDRFHYTGPVPCGCWQTWTKIVPYPKKFRPWPKPNNAFKEWVAERRRVRGTSLAVNKRGVVVYVWVFRGDVQLQ